MKYLVTAGESPRFLSRKKAVQVLEGQVLPSMNVLMKLEAQNKILGGLPVGERCFVFIAEADSNDELDRLLHAIPVWGAMNWKVTPLETFEGRVSQELEFVEKFKREENKLAVIGRPASHRVAGSRSVTR